MDPRLGTDTSGPGEAVFAIRFNGKPQFLWKIRNYRTRKKIRKFVRNPFFGTIRNELSVVFNRPLT